MRLLISSLLLAFSTVALAADHAEDAKVKVIAIWASDRNKEVDPKLKDIAEQVQKDHPTLTGFRIERQTHKTVALNQKEIFPLAGDLVAEVTVQGIEDKGKKLRVLVKSKESREVNYTIAGEKYFPIMTSKQDDKDKDRLIFAVQVKPIPKPAEKEKEKEKMPEKKD